MTSAKYSKVENVTLVQRAIARVFGATGRGALEFVMFASVLLVAAPTDRSLSVGLVIIFIGILFRVIASGYRYAEDSFKVRGPYRYVRHPHHLGTILAAVGFAVASANVWAVVMILAVSAWYFRRVIVAEERRLAKNWGPRYAIFRANVSAIVPQLIPFVPAGGEGSRFSLRDSLTKDHAREPKFLIGAVAGLATLYLNTVVLSRGPYLATIGACLVIFLLFRGIYYGYAGKARRTRGVVTITET